MEARGLFGNKMIATILLRFWMVGNIDDGTPKKKVKKPFRNLQLFIKNGSSSSPARTTIVQMSIVQTHFPTKVLLEN